MTIDGHELSQEALEELRASLRARPDVAQVLVGRRVVEPRSEESFVDASVVVVLEVPPSEAPSFESLRGLPAAVYPAVRDLGPGTNVTVPSRAGLAAAVSGAVVVYEREP